MSGNAPPPYPGNDGIPIQQPYNPNFQSQHTQYSNYNNMSQQPPYPNHGYPPQQGYYNQQGYPQQPAYGAPPPQVIYVNERRDCHQPRSGKDSCCLWALLGCCFGCCLADCCD
uniref:CYSTM domain-containing protein n=1 Tax=Strongyloides venezuelensis TaxID=75913 RepID=A0A0K0F2K8_STRVS